MSEFKEHVTNLFPFRECPRQLAVPQRIDCYSQVQFFDRFNRNNGIKRKLYVSINKINLEGNFEGVSIDWIPFDLDSELSLENTRKIYHYCKEHNYKSMYMFSTGGFWAFIETTKVVLKNPKYALMTAQQNVAKDLNFTIGQGKNGDLDRSIIGDIARITRLPNSKDVGRRRFCLILKAEELLNMTYEEICQLASKPRMEYYSYGEVLFDLTQYDTEPEVKSAVKNDFICDMSDLDLTDADMDIDIERFLPCVQSWLCHAPAGVWKNRYWYAVYCSQVGIPSNKCDEIARKFFSKQPRSDRLRNNYNHFQLDGVIRKAYKVDKYFPNCDTLIMEGSCPGRCSQYAGANSPIYYNPDDEPYIESSDYEEVEIEEEVIE